MRFEARPHGLPLQPGIEQSSPTAPSPRERFSKQDVLPATENFRIGPEGLFASVRGELATVKHYVPEATLPHDANQRITVAIASSNNKKVDSILSQITNYQLDVIRIPEADELHTKDALTDATSKALDAARIIQTSEEDSRREVRNKPHVTIANDQVNAVPVVTEHPLTHMPIVAFERKGKPQNENHDNPEIIVKEMFGQLANTAEKYHWPSIPYLIELATVIHNPQNPDDNAVSLERSAVFLSVEGVKHLATDRFEEYKQKVQEQTSRTNGKKGVADIAGGLEFQVLKDMGIITFVSGTPGEIQTKGFPPNQRPEAYNHAYEIALGMSNPRIILEYFAGENT